MENTFKPFIKKIKENKKIVLIFIFVFIGLFIITFASYNVSKLLANVTVEAPSNNNFEDIDFYKCIVDTYNKEQNKEISYRDYLSNSEISKISMLSCNNMEIESAKGIEILTGIEKLDLSDNKLTSIDLSKNLVLRSIIIDNNSLTSIVTNGVSLESLSLSNNKLEDINLSENSNLERLTLNDNNITNLNIDSNTKLKNISIQMNKLTSLNLSNNANLEALLLNNNKLTDIDLSNNLNLQTVFLDNNEISNITLGNLPSLNLLSLYNNNLSSINLSTVPSSLSLGKNKLGQDIPTLFVNKTYTIKDKITLPDGYSLNYVIGNTTKAKVENGIVTALEEGSTSLRTFIVFPEDSNGEVRTYEASDASIINIMKAKLTSDKYIIDDDKKIVYTKSDISLDTIKDNLNVSLGDIVIEDNKVKVIYNNDPILEYEIVNYSIDYPIKDNYIIVGSNTFDISKINVYNDNTEYDYDIENKIINIKYKNDVIDTLKIASYNIEEYEVITDDGNNYIYIKDKEFDTSKIAVINCDYEIKDDKIIIKAGNNIIKTIYLSSLKTKDSNYEIKDSSIFVGTDEFTKDDISCVNCVIEDETNYTYKIRVGNNFLDLIKIVKINSSDNDKLSTIKEFGYLYLGIKKLSNFYDFKVINGYTDEKDDELIIYSSSDKKTALKSIKLLRISSDYYDLDKGYSQKDNGYYIFEKSINTDKIIVTGNLEIKLKDDGNYAISLKNNDIEFETIYLSYIMDDSNYTLNKDYVYYGLVNSSDLKLNIKNGYAIKNGSSFDIYINNGKKVDTIKIVSLITDYSLDGKYDFKNSTLDLKDSIFNPLLIKDMMNSEIIYSTKDGVLKILYSGKVLDQIKIKSTYKIVTTTSTTTRKTTKTNNTTTTTRLETKENKVTTKNANNNTIKCNRCNNIRIITIVLLIIYILFLSYIIHIIKKEKKKS